MNNARFDSQTWTLRRFLDRQRHVTLARHLRAIGDGGKDVFVLEAGVILQQFFFRDARGEVVEYQGYPDARTAYAGPAEADTRINRDTFAQFFVFHG